MRPSTGILGGKQQTQPVLAEVQPHVSQSRQVRLNHRGAEVQKTE